MANASYLLLVFTILGYLAAMILYAAQYAFGDRGPVARVATRPARAPALAAAGEGGAAGQAPPAPASPDQPDAQAAQAAVLGTGDAARRSTPLARVALAVLLVAAGLHLATVVTRGIAAERLPWGDMYEFLLSTTLVGVAAWLFIAVRYPSWRHLSLYVALANLILLGAALILYSPVEPLVPALDSAWFIIHVAAAALASGIFLIGFVTAAMFLIRSGYERGSRRFPYPLGAKAPAADTVERLTFRLTAFAFPIWTFAVIAGAIWAEASWGRYWAWDPKEVWAFISWVLYAGYLHARATPSVKRTTAAWLAIIGFLTILMNLFGVNLLFESLHSYA
jgi:cytochrome c-type biogenesis protein CcsB